MNMAKVLGLEEDSQADSQADFAGDVTELWAGMKAHFWAVC